MLLKAQSHVRDPGSKGCTQWLLACTACPSQLRQCMPQVANLFSMCTCLLLCRTWHLWVLWQAVPGRRPWLPAAPDVNAVHRQHGRRQSRRGGSPYFVSSGLRFTAPSLLQGVGEVAGK